VERKLAANDATPAIRGVMASRLRTSLIQLELWARTRAALRARAPEVEAEVGGWRGYGWVTLEDWLRLVDAIGEVADPPLLREVGRTWMRGELSEGRLAHVLRSWLRAFSRDPLHLARITPHFWRAVFRRNGRIEVANHGRGFVRLSLYDAVSVQENRTWQLLLEGTAMGLMELVDEHVEVQIAAVPDDARVDLLILWRV